MSIFNYADYILLNYSGSQSNITPMKIQKLLFYVKAWSIVEGSNLIPETFIHMKYGPLNQDIYNKYKSFGSSQITKPKIEPVNISNIEFVDFILENYMEFNAIELSSMTHNEKPWIETKDCQPIDDNKIKNYYKEQPFAKNFPLDIKNNPFYPLMSDTNHSFVFDMSYQDASEVLTFDNYLEYKELKTSTKKHLDKKFRIK